MLEAAVILESILTCPHCGTAKTETMPTDASGNCALQGRVMWFLPQRPARRRHWLQRFFTMPGSGGQSVALRSRRRLKRALIGSGPARAQHYAEAGEADAKQGKRGRLGAAISVSRKSALRSRLLAIAVTVTWKVPRSKTTGAPPEKARSTLGPKVKLSDSDRVVPVIVMLLVAVPVKVPPTGST
jgi:hypothetical protein